jgi:hypothetical protein
MAEYGAVATLTTPGLAPDITFNDPATSIGFHDPGMCSGLEKLVAARAITQNRPRTDGAILFPRLKGPRQITLGGWVRASTVAAREQFLVDLADALDALSAGGGTYSWASALGNLSISDVWWDGMFAVTGSWIKKYQFNLVVDSDAISGL